MALSGGSRSEVSVTKGKGFSELAVERGFCKPKHIVAAVQEQNRMKREEGIERSLKEILLERGVLSPTQVEELEAARRGAKIIAGFEILDKVGQGAMGSVFKARQIALDRVVALKILSPKLARDATFKERFLREARFTAKLNHLHVISGIDCGEEHGYLYFAMEFVSGRTTGQILKEKGKLSVEEAVKIVRQVADALQYAHSFDLVHRDVKPDNVMVDQEGTAKLCDLGLATLRRVERSDRWGDKDDDDSSEAGATRAGRVVGTPFYLSPEQAKGSESVDCRCDIYSLGATLFHYLTGRPPFEGRSREVMRQHVKGEAPSVCELNTEVPVVLGQIVSKMMAKDPAERYADPEALIADLDAAVDGRAVTAADFRGKTSCALPARNLRRPPMPRPKQRPVEDIIPVLKKKQDSTKKMEPATPTVRGSRVRRARRSSDNMSAIVFMVLALVAAVALYSYMSQIPTPPPPPSKPAVVTTPPRTDPVRRPAPAKKKIEQQAPETEPNGQEALGRVVDVPETPTPVTRPDVPEKPEITQTTPVPQGVDQQKALAMLVSELTKRVASGELAQADAVVSELAARPEFADLKDQVVAERADLAAARAYEVAAIRSVVAAQPRKAVRLTDAGRQKCEGREEVTLDSFDPERGVGASLGPVGIVLQPSHLSPGDLVRKAEGAGDPVGRVCYLIARGRISSARRRLPQLPGEVRQRLEKKLSMLTEYEKESEASDAFEELEKMAAAGQFATLRSSISAFLQAHGNTTVAQVHAAKLDEWKRKAEETGVPDLTRQFSVPAEQLPNGGYAFAWTSKEMEQFEKDWIVDDPQADHAGFLLWKPQFDTLLSFRGKSGEFWDGKRSGAVVVVPKQDIKAPAYRLEVCYTLGIGCNGGFIAGVGLWDGGERGVAFGPREGRGGRLSIAGSPPGLEGNFEKDRLPSAILAGRGYLAVEVRGGEWRFLSRRFEDTADEAWREAFTLKGAENAKPAIMPITWATGKIEFIIHKVRLVILPAK